MKQRFKNIMIYTDKGPLNLFIALMTEIILYEILILNYLRHNVKIPI